MKSLKKILFPGLFVFVFSAALGAQSLKGMSLNGATGLYTIPAARIGWDQNAEAGLDLGYHAVAADSQISHIPALSLSLFRWLEISAAFDMQPEYINNYVYNDDLLLGLKIQFPPNLTGGDTSLAFGGNFQIHNLKDGGEPKPADKKRGSADTAFQIYGAVSYRGAFFSVPAETTVVLGKTFILFDAFGFDKSRENKNIDFGMGFDLALFPKALQNYVHLIIDFSNFAYSVLPYPSDINGRGILNAGFRFDLSGIPPLRKFKFDIDVLGADLLDESRAFSFGLLFGIPLSS
ncbi:MAG: hypothetical protein LBT95_01245 [Treponema sp.]|jgi:hypothetical protein|nr:hypothetical protein [Treponema sp.]